MAWKQKLAEIYVDITAKLSPLKGAMAKANAMVKRNMASLTRLAKRGAAAIGVALAAAFYYVTRAAIKQEDAVARLETTLRATGYAAGWTKKQILKLAADLQKITRFGDETIIALQTMLLTFKQIKGDEFERATMAALDMATAEAAVSGRTVDLTAASIRLGKALNDPILGVTALRRVGVQLTKQQEEQIKVFMRTGQVAKAQRVILGELERQFGGMSRTVDTAGGKIESMWHVIGDVAEVIGKKILDKLTPIVDAIKAWVLANEALIEQKIDEYFDKTWKALEKVGKALEYTRAHWKRVTIGVITFYSILVGLIASFKVLVKVVSIAFVKATWAGTKAVTAWIVAYAKLSAAAASVMGWKAGIKHAIEFSRILHVLPDTIARVAAALVSFKALVVASVVAVGHIVYQLGAWAKALYTLWKAKRDLARWEDPAYAEEQKRLRRERMAETAREKAAKKEVTETKKVVTAAEEAAEAVVEAEKKTTSELREEYIARLELARDYYESMEGYEKELYDTRLKLMKLRAQDIARELGISEAAALAGLAAREAKERAAAAPIEAAIERAKVGFAGFGDAWSQIAQQLTGREKVDMMQLREQQQQTKYLRSISEDIKDIELEEGGFT